MRVPMIGKLAAAALVGAVGLTSLWAGASEARSADEERAMVSELELIDLRNTMSRSQLDELLVRMLEAFELADRDEREAVVNNRVRVVAASRAELTLLLDRADVDGEEVETLLQGIEEAVPESYAAGMYALFNGSLAVKNVGVDAVGDPPSVADAIRQLSWLDHPSQMVQLESLVVAFERNSPSASRELTEFFDLAAAYIAGQPRVFGTDPARPLAGTLISTEAARLHESPSVDQITRLLDESDLWHVDRWNNDPDAIESEAPPLDLEALQEQTQSVIEASRSLIDERIAQRLAEAEAAAEAADGRARLAHAVALVLLAIAAVAAAAVAAAHWSHSRELRRRIDVDPLTGVGNRNVLVTQTASLLADPDLGHHTVVMVDLDRFKLTNDTHGHAAGDQVLRRLANGLTEVGASLRATATTVVRLGGDEFMLSVHHDEPIDVVTLNFHLDALRRETITLVDESAVALEFSFGIVTETGAPKLDRLMHAADLAAYEDKARRRHRHDRRMLEHDATV